MADNTRIEWADATFNPWIGCTKVSPACDRCYAAVSTPARALGISWGAGERRRRTSAANWKLPLRWNAKRFMECGECGWRGECDAELIGCASCGSSGAMNHARRRVFCASLADVFDNEVPIAWRIELFDLIRATPNLDWLLLTKRIGNAERMMDEAGGWSGATKHGVRNPLPNLWIGATVANQFEADRDVPKLLHTSATVRWLSCEPLLGPINLTDICDGAAHREIPREYWTDIDDDDSPPAIGINALTGSCWQRFGDWQYYGQRLDWVIVGGESGQGARPMHPSWARGLRNQCDIDGVPFLFKQWGEWAPHQVVAGGDMGADLRAGRVRFMQGDGREPDGHFLPGDAAMERVGKRAAGRLLDGREHNEWPRTANLKEI